MTAASTEASALPPAFDRTRPFNTLPPLPPAVAVETPAVLRKAIAANRALAELKGMAQRMPNQAMLIDSLVLQEARASSEIENILTTTDELYQAASDDLFATGPEAKEVLRYREALHFGFQAIGHRPLATPLFVEIAQRIKETRFDIRRTPGTQLKSPSGEVVYTPPDGEERLRDMLGALEQFIHRDESAEADGLDSLVKMALVHYQFEAIHPFPDGNGRTGRILNVLLLVSWGLLDLPVLYLSRYITRNKAAYYEGLRAVTERQDWQRWVLLMLDAVEQTSVHTRSQIVDILALMEAVQDRLRAEAPKVYSKDLVEHVFRHPYCKISFLEKAGMGTRQTCAKYLTTLVDLGLLVPRKVGREKYFMNQALIGLLTG